MSVRGDFAKLAELRKRLAKLASDARLAVNKVAAEEAVKIIDDTFRAGEDPHGQKWAPLKFRDGQPLRDTGTHLQNTLTPKVTATGFTVSTSFIGARVHQHGATIRAKNPRMRFGGAGSDGMDMVTMGRPLLTFKVSSMRTHVKGGIGPIKRGVRESRWISVEQVTIPRRQYMPEGPDYGPRWNDGMRRAVSRYLRASMGAA